MRKIKCNDGTGDTNKGNYWFTFSDKIGRLWKGGEVNNFPRKKLLAWDLLYRCLESKVSDRNQTTNSAPNSLTDKIKQLETTLEFYADKDNYTTTSKGFAAQYDPSPPEIQADEGQKARDMLNKKGYK